VVFGGTHFLIVRLIAGLAPAWIPGALFWAYFRGTAFIAAGLECGERMDGAVGGDFAGKHVSTLVLVSPFIPTHEPVRLP
jgi:hypothetical protein